MTESKNQIIIEQDKKVSNTNLNHSNPQMNVVQNQYGYNNDFQNYSQNYQQYYKQQQQQYMMYNQNMQVNPQGYNQMYLPNQTLNNFQYQQMWNNQYGDPDFGDAYSEWYDNANVQKEEEPKEEKKKEEKKNAAKHTNDNCWIIFRVCVNIGVWTFIIFYLFELLFEDPQAAETNYDYGFIVVGLWWCYDICCSESSRYLRNKKDKNATKKQIKEVQNRKPHVQFHAECYHYETRTREVTYTEDGETKTRYETYTEKVVTHTATENFKYRYWADCSIDIERMIDKTKVLRLESIKKLLFYDEKTEKKYNKKYIEFKRNNNRDVHQNYWETIGINGFESEILSSDHDYWWTSYLSWFILSTVFLNSIQAYMFFNYSRKYKYPVCKMISHKRRMDLDSDDSDCSRSDHSE